MDLAFNRRLIVTGADSGIGLHTAMTLAAVDAAVLMSDLDEGALEAARAEVKRRAPAASVYTESADLTKPKEVERFLESAEQHGGVAVLAHIAGARGAAGDFLEPSDES